MQFRILQTNCVVQYARPDDKWLTPVWNCDQMNALMYEKNSEPFLQYSINMHKITFLTFITILKLFISILVYANTYID